MRDLRRRTRVEESLLFVAARFLNTKFCKTERLNSVWLWAQGMPMLCFLRDGLYCTRIGRSATLPLRLQMVHVFRVANSFCIVVPSISTGPCVILTIVLCQYTCTSFSGDILDARSVRVMSPAATRRGPLMARLDPGGRHLVKQQIRL